MSLIKQVSLVAERYLPDYAAGVAGYLAFDRREATIELFDSSPCLGLMLAYCRDFIGWMEGEPWEAAADMVTRPRCEIMGWLGFPATRAAANVVGKVRTTELTIEDCLRLRTLLTARGGPRKWLNHLHAVNHEVIRILADPSLARLVSFAFLADIPKAAYASSISETLLETAVLVAALRPFYVRAVRLGLGQALWPVTSVDHLLCLRGASQEAVILGIPEPVPPQYAELAFPEPPVSCANPPPGLRIEPLTSIDDLNKEAAEQHNCLMIYGPGIATGCSYAYRVLAPERASVLVLRDADGYWAIADIKATGNGPVSKKTRFLVAECFARAQARNSHVAESTIRNETDSKTLPMDFLG